MEGRLKEILWTDERLRWCGRPRPFVLLDRALRPVILLTWTLSAAALLAAAAVVRFVAATSLLPLSEILLLASVALFLPLALSLRPFLDKYSLEARTIYAITDRRIIAIVRDDVMYLPLAAGMRVDVDAQADGCGNLRFGEAAGVSASRNRSCAVAGIRSDDRRGGDLGLLFYHVDQPERLLSYLA